LKEYNLSNKGYIVKVEGVGFKCKQDVAVIHSEFGALIAEKWKNAVESQKELGILPKRAIESLQFQTRDNSGPIIPEPDVSDVDLSGNFFQGLFDQYLP
jgi:DNA-binding transcriptional regulator YhcF (GntR family)